MRTRMGLGIVTVLCIAVGLVGVSSVLAATRSSTVKDVKSLSERDPMNLALSAAPAHIINDATVMVYGEDGKLKEARPGTNGFICVPSVMNPVWSKNLSGL